MTAALGLLIAYLLGDIPFGFLLVKLTTGRDVRASGSGNIGATNVLRTTGRAAGRSYSAARYGQRLSSRMAGGSSFRREHRAG